MRTFQRKQGGCVIKLSWRKGTHAVTIKTFVAEIVSDVIGIRNRFKIGLMTTETFSWYVGISCTVTIDTVDRGMRAFQRKQGGCVIKLRGRKSTHAVTIRTFMAEIVGDVIGIRNRFKIGLMTTETFSWYVGISCTVTIDTVDRGMRAFQRKQGGCVVKLCGRKSTHAVTIRTFMAEIVGDVIGISYRFKISLMTAVTFSRNIDISCGMTIDTICSCMSTFQWEQSGCMIKLGRRKGIHAVAVQTLVTEIVGDMIGIGHGFKIGLVTTVAFGWNVGISCTVAIDTICYCMRTFQREQGGCVIKLRWRKGIHAVAVRTFVIEIVGDVIGFRNRFKISLMTAVTFSGYICISYTVTVDTVGGCMSTFQRKQGGCMVKLSGRKSTHAVTVRTLVAEIVGDVIGVRNRFEIRLMTAVTFCWNIGIAYGMTIDTIN